MFQNPSYKIIEERFDPDIFRYSGIYYYNPSAFRWLTSISSSYSFSDYFYIKITVYKEDQATLLLEIESHKIPSLYKVLMGGTVVNENTIESRCEFEVRRFQINSSIPSFLLHKIKTQVIRMVQNDITDLIERL